MIFWFSNQEVSDLIAAHSPPEGETTTKWCLEVWLEAQEGHQESPIYLRKSKFGWVVSWAVQWEGQVGTSQSSAVRQSRQSSMK